MFGFKLNFTVDKNKTAITNSFGGLATLGFVFVAAFYLGWQVLALHNREQVNF